jgi:murein L,D-transpeptidase YcbB/YkuD
MSLEKHYAAQRERTTTLVVQAIDALRRENARISLSSIARKSRELDSDGKGISEAAILKNPEAHDYYREHRSWQKSSAELASTNLDQIRWGRDDKRAHSRYKNRYTKDELVEQLVAAERRFLDMRETLHEQGEELLLVQSHADRIEAELDEIKAHKNGAHSPSAAQRKLLSAYGWSYLYSQFEANDTEQHVIVQLDEASLEIRIVEAKHIEAFIDALREQRAPALPTLQPGQAFQEMSNELARLRMALEEAEKSIAEQQKRIGQQESKIEDLRHALAKELMTHKEDRKSS